MQNQKAVSATNAELRFNPDECLASFTNAASSANAAMLKTLFGQCWKDLSAHKEHQAKAKEVYDLRTQELTPQA